MRPPRLPYPLEALEKSVVSWLAAAGTLVAGLVVAVAGAGAEPIRVIASDESGITLELTVPAYKLVPDPTPESLWLGLRIERKLGDRLAEASLATQLRRRYSNSSEYQSLLRGDFD